MISYETQTRCSSFDVLVLHTRLGKLTQVFFYNLVKFNLIKNLIISKPVRQIGYLYKTKDKFEICVKLRFLCTCGLQPCSMLSNFYWGFRGGRAFINYTFSRLFSIIRNISQANKVINQWVVSNLKCNLILINLCIINLKLTR